MFRKILLPLDLTSKHDPAIRTAIDLARRGDGAVCLLHVIEDISGVARDEEAEFFGRIEQSAKEHLLQIAQEFEQERIEWQIDIRRGERIRQILEFALNNEIDLIIVTVPVFDPQQVAASWGSLSWKIGVLAPCPTLLVK